MKKTILSLALALLLTFALSPAVAAVQIQDGEYTFTGGSVLSSSIITPHEYLGKATLGNLWLNGELCQWKFAVFVVDDSVDELVERFYYIERNPDLYVERIPGDFYADGTDSVILYFDYNYADMVHFDMATESNPLLVEFDRSFGWLVFGSAAHVFQQYTADWDPYYYVGYLALVFTESEVATFLSTGKLPPTSEWEDLSPYLDLTDLKKTLSGWRPATWSAAAVEAAIAADLLPESLQYQYKHATTRTEFCALAVELYENLKGEITERKTFTDTTDVNVEKCAAIGVVNGTNPEGTLFSPDMTLNREQAATMLSRLAEAIGKPLPGQAATFTDAATVSSYAQAAVGQMQATGVMTGVGANTFAPKDTYTREQSILTIMRLYELMK